MTNIKIFNDLKPLPNQKSSVVLHHETTINTHTNNNNMKTYTRVKIDGLSCTYTTEQKVRHQQKDTTNGAKRVRVEAYKDMAFNSVIRVMQKSERTNKRREERRARR